MGVTFTRDEESREARWHVRPNGFEPFDMVLTRGTLLHGVTTGGLFDEGGAGVRRRLVVVDERVADIYGDGIRSLFSDMGREGVDFKVMQIEATEAKKTTATVSAIMEGAFAFELSRTDAITGIGGGIVADVVGAAAAQLHKGLRYELIMTTLTGIVDAGYAGKRRVNHRAMKNAVGPVWMPGLVIGDVGALATLPPRHIRAGMAEVMKVAEMTDMHLFRLLEDDGTALVAERFGGSTESAELLRRAIDAPLRHIAADPRDSQKARWLDSHHLLAHPLEMATDNDLCHGEAVSICGAVTATVAQARGLIGTGTHRDMVELRRLLKLPVVHPLAADGDFVARAITAAVSQRGAQHIPVPAAIGGFMILEDVTAAEVVSAAKRLIDMEAA